MSDIGARFVACKGWRWLPGMHWRRDFAGGQSLGDRTGMILNEWDAVDDGGRIFRIGALDGMEPVQEDPATLGCILALVREAWDDPYIVCVPPMRQVDPEWGVGSTSTIGAVGRIPCHGATEAEALLAALEAAP